ncbi:hypothetical protein MKK63_24435 [Methylobacterium sp. J-088]|uniref:hypothetical protein n=1 Tax=Methylobacterium sp. J-088 TaxID=2836664 RepID=UPI001FB9C27D|nr:hypothetical protein [Methylobacterium sp. J-088]MCJ2065828.1 hypothetical protein [Methylobacterium sp. J-088]
MNDMTLLDPDDLPEWAWEIAERYDLIPRSDSPYTGAMALVMNAACDLKKLSRRLRRKPRLTNEMVQEVAACAAMLADAAKLASLCPEQFSAEEDAKADDGSLISAKGTPK